MEDRRPTMVIDGYVALTSNLVASAMNPRTALATPNSATTADTMIILPARNIPEREFGLAISFSSGVVSESKTKLRLCVFELDHWLWISRDARLPI
jgi:hypothetical protein